MSRNSAVTNAFAGIDVSVSNKKRLAICVCTLKAGNLAPLKLKDDSDVGPPPLGIGNCRTVDDEAVAAFADRVVAYLRVVQDHCQVRIERIAIDAPAAPGPVEGEARDCEREMDKEGISYIRTPSFERFKELRRLAKERCLDSKADHSGLQGANQLWMLVGFKLFDRLTQARFDCIETYPNAILHALGMRAPHKSKTAGFDQQWKRIQCETTVPPSTAELHTYCYGHRHDKLDALMAAWVASLPESQRRRYGTSDADGIWVPTSKGATHLHL